MGTRYRSRRPQPRSLSEISHETSNMKKFELRDKKKLQRFLHTGSVDSTYNAFKSKLIEINENELVLADQAEELFTELLQSNETTSQELIRIVVDAYNEGSSCGKEIALITLASCCASPLNPTVDQKNLLRHSLANEARANINQICTEPSNILEFAKLYAQLNDRRRSNHKTGWGRAHRTAIQRWYNNKRSYDVAFAVTSCSSLNCWRHKDLLRLCHLKPTKSTSLEVLCTYIVKGYKDTKSRYHQYGANVNNQETTCVDLLAIDESNVGASMDTVADIGTSEENSVSHRFSPNNQNLVENVSENVDEDAETAGMDAQTADKDTETAGMNAETAGMDAQTADKDAETADVKAQTIGMDVQIADVDAQIADVDAQRDDADAQRDDADAQRDDADAQRDDADAQRDDADAQRDDADAQRDDADAQRDDVDAQRDDVDVQRDDVDVQRDDADAQSDDADAQSDDADAQSDDVDAQIADVDAQKDDADAQRDDADAQRDDVDAQRDDVDVQRDDVDTQIANVDAQTPDEVVETDKIAELLKFFDAIDTLKHSRSPEEIASLFATYKLTWDHLPCIWHNDIKLWKKLVLFVSLKQLIINLPRLHALQLLEADSLSSKFIIRRLMNSDEIKKSCMHPFEFFCFYSQYDKGKCSKKKYLTYDVNETLLSVEIEKLPKKKTNKWSPDRQILSALNTCFYSSLANVKPIKGRLNVTVEVSMTGEAYCSNYNLTCSSVAAALCFLFHCKCEKDFVLKTFSKKANTNVPLNKRLELVDIRNCDTIDAVESKINKVQSAKFVDLALPMIYEKKSDKIKIDSFILIVSDEKKQYGGRTKPHKALNDYREKVNPDAKLVLLELRKKGSQEETFKDPDAGVLHISGFNETVPMLICNFISGVF